MAVVKEKEPLVLPDNKNPERRNSEEITVKPPEPLMTAIYQNGKGNRIEEEIILSTFDESGIVRKIKGEIETLRKKLDRIPSQLQEIPKKKREHGGRLVSKSKQTQRRERLGREMVSIPSRIVRREGVIKQLKTILTSSDPFDPVQLEVVRAKIRIQEGQLLSEEDQEFWRYVRKVAPEIYRHIESGQEELFRTLHGLFCRRLDFHTATGEKKEKANKEFYRFIEGIKGKKYDPISEDLKKITRHFTRVFKP